MKEPGGGGRRTSLANPLLIDLIFNELERLSRYVETPDADRVDVDVVWNCDRYYKLTI